MLSIAAFMKNLVLIEYGEDSCDFPGVEWWSSFRPKAYIVDQDEG